MIGEKILKFKELLLSIFDPTREKFLLNTIRYGVYLALLTPLVFSKSFFPPPVPPTIFFRLVVDIILIFYIVLAITSPNYRPKFNFLTIAVSLFLGIVILTSFTGVNIEKSLWGNFDRMGGVITFVHLFGFFIILSSVFREKKDWERVFTFSIFVGVLVVLFILFSNQFSIKEGGTLWNSSLMASYLLFNIYFAIALFLTKNGVMQIFYGTSLVVLIPTLFLSGCRGAMVSFFIGLFLLALGYFIFLKRKLLKFFILGVFLVSIIFSSILLFTNLNFVKNTYKTILEDPSLQSRFIVWQVAWEGWKEKFLFGWGPENFDVAFFKYFDPVLTMPKYGAANTFDRAHNIILDIGVTSGVLGVLSYLAIFATVFFVLLKKLKESLDKNGAIFLVSITVILAVYFLQNLLSLDAINSYLMFFLTLGFINYILEQKNPQEFGQIKIVKKYIYSLIGIVFIIFVILMTYFGDIQEARASFYIKKAQHATLKESIFLFQKSFQVHPISQLDGSKYFYDKISQSFSESSINRETAKKDLQTIGEEMEKNIKKNPLDLYLHLQLADVYRNSFQFDGDKKNLIFAESILKEAILLSPKNSPVYWKLAKVMYSQGKYKEQFELLQKAIDLEPRLADSHWYLAMAYTIAGEKKLSREKITEIKKIQSELVNGQITIKELKKFYRTWEDYYAFAYVFQESIKNNPSKALLDIQKYLKDNPQDLNANIFLFLTYIQMGEIDKARDLRKSNLNLLSESMKVDSTIILQDAENKYKKIPN